MALSIILGQMVLCWIGELPQPPIHIQQSANHFFTAVYIVYGLVFLGNVDLKSRDDPNREGRIDQEFRFA